MDGGEGDNGDSEEFRESVMEAQLSDAKLKHWKLTYNRHSVEMAWGSRKVYQTVLKHGRINALWGVAQQPSCRDKPPRARLLDSSFHDHDPAVIQYKVLYGESSSAISVKIFEARAASNDGKNESVS